MSVAAAGLQLTTVGTAAIAQSKPDLEEIVVTATRREQIDPGDSVQYLGRVSGETLERANITDAVEALRTMPGVSVQDRGYRNGGVASGIVIRGINVDSGTNGDVPLAAPPTVATYVDDTALFGNFVLEGHRARRSAARPAGHALWLGLACRQRALHHEQAGSAARSAARRASTSA